MKSKTLLQMSAVALAGFLWGSSALADDLQLPTDQQSPPVIEAAANTGQLDGFWQEVLETSVKRADANMEAQKPSDGTGTKVLLTAADETAVAPKEDAPSQLPEAVEDSSDPLGEYLTGETCLDGADCLDNTACLGCPAPKTRIFADFLYLAARDADLVYATPTTGFGTGATPIGDMGIVDPGYEPGMRFGVSRSLGEWGEVEATYTRFESNAIDAISTSANNGTYIQSNVTHPAVNAGSGNPTAATAGYDIDFDLVDVDVKRSAGDMSGFAAKWLAGVRYGHLNQDFNSALVNVGNTTVSTDVEFEGVGLRLGLEGERQNCSGILIYGRGIVNMMFGEFKGSYLQQDFAGVTAMTTYTDDRIVPVGELELGVGWTSPSGRITVRCGYYVAGWFNSLTTPGFIRAVQTGNFSSSADELNDTLMFDGLVVRTGLAF